MSSLKPLEVGQAVLAAVKERLDAVAADLARLQKAEAVGKSLFGMPSSTPSEKQLLAQDDKRVLTKTVFQFLKKGETFISTKHSADPKKRDVDVGFEGVVPSDRKEASVSTDGAGSPEKDTKAPKSKTVQSDDKAVAKAGEDMSAKPPTSIKPPTTAAPAPKGAAAGQAPKAPKAPGASITMKNENCVGVFAKIKKVK